MAALLGSMACVQPNARVTTGAHARERLTAHSKRMQRNCLGNKANAFATWLDVQHTHHMLREHTRELCECKRPVARTIPRGHTKSHTNVSTFVATMPTHLLYGLIPVQYTNHRLRKACDTTNRPATCAPYRVQHTTRMKAPYVYRYGTGDSTKPQYCSIAPSLDNS